ncbi:GAF domain-containing sensor histidine kinase [Parabacteroides sp. OttesenSCG-928-G07]|nr:GAF domain-containing sensor histidine kinase [Parabacteroides sp. OttesenSCG-928-G21]MDL2277561.1 GAF domain-containing sensor histidine kinase [Parabacteroides sp. OttesenSCG-928-G07]
MTPKSSIKQVISDIVLLLFKSDKTESIKKAFATLIDYFQVDWIYIGILNKCENCVKFYYGVTSPQGKPSFDNSLNVLSFDDIPWTINAILSGKSLLIPDINHLPPKASKDKMMYQKQQLKSTLIIPIKYQKKTHGFIGFDSIEKKRDWLEEEIEELQVLAHIFSVIIERKIKEYEIDEAKRLSNLELQRLREADSLKSAFLANISHEIRTPLNAIIGFSSLIAETDDVEERKHYQSIIEKNNKLLLQLLSDIIEFSIIESLQPNQNYSHCNLKTVCYNISRKYVKRNHSNLKFIFQDTRHPDIMIFTDKNRLEKVLTNLISNAYKFTPSGIIELSYQITQNNIKITVDDTGIGIEPKYHQSIFERFTKLNSFSQGTGLGLSLCQTIVNSLNGKIGVESVPEEGSSFWVTLPCSNNNGLHYPESLNHKKDGLMTS